MLEKLDSVKLGLGPGASEQLASAAAVGATAAAAAAGARGHGTARALSPLDVSGSSAATDPSPHRPSSSSSGDGGGGGGSGISRVEAYDGSGSSHRRSRTSSATVAAAAAAAAASATPGPSRNSEKSGLTEWARDHPPATEPNFQVDRLEGDGRPWSLLRHMWVEVVGEEDTTTSLRSRDSSGSQATDFRRERVYNTMFHVPWRVELLVLVGYLVCLDSVLELITLLPLRLCLLLWRLPSVLIGRRRLRVGELRDVTQAVLLVLGILLLLHANVSRIYHWIRGQSVIKLVVVFNVVEVLDRLFQNLGADVFTMMFNMTQSVAVSSPHRLPLKCMTLLVDECIALAAFSTHALLILCQAITLNVAMNSHNNMLLTMLVSNNFAEVKSNVFKRFSQENVHKLACQDTVERFHLSCALFFVTVQTIFRGQGASVEFFFLNVGTVWLCETVVDGIKHSFLAKFNEIKPEAYSDFLQTLCRQIVEHGSHTVHRSLVFVPLAPTCMVLRTLIPFLSFIPSSFDVPRLYLPRFVTPRFLLFLLCALSLLLAKILLTLILRTYSCWYLSRSLEKRRQKLREAAAGHAHAD